MEAAGEVPRQPSYIDRAKAAYEHTRAWATVITTSMVLANTVGGNDLVVRADDPLLRQTELALPSAFVAPDMEDFNKAVGIGSQIILTTLGAGLAQNTTRPSEMVGIATIAQLGSSMADAAIERTGLLTHAERAQEDVGSSAIYVAWIFKFLLDRTQASENHKLRWRIGIGTFATAAAVGLPLFEGSQGGKLEAVSHTVSLAVGYGAHKLSERKKLAHLALEN